MRRRRLRRQHVRVRYARNRQRNNSGNHAHENLQEQTTGPTMRERIVLSQVFRAEKRAKRREVPVIYRQRPWRTRRFRLGKREWFGRHRENGSFPRPNFDTLDGSSRVLVPIAVEALGSRSRARRHLEGK